MDNYYIDSFGEIIPMLTDLHGKPVERTPYSHPYSFDQHVTWISEKFDKNKIYSAEYSDRMLGWDREKFARCTQEVFKNQKQYFDVREPKDIEKFLIKYFGHNLELVAIEKCCNLSSGYPIWIFHFEEID